VLSFLCLGLRRVFEFLTPLGRSADRKELEILVLRHELKGLGGCVADGGEGVASAGANGYARHRCPLHC
jgi:hypothetical protein